MDEQERVNIAEKDFKDAREGLTLFFDYAKETENSFLKIKMSFLAFLGILFSIALNQREDYSNTFLIFLVIIVFFIFFIAN